MALSISILVLCVLGAMLFFLFEFLTPTFGPLAGLGVACLVGAVWAAYTLSPALAVIVGVGEVVLTPVYIVLLIKYLPRLPFGRKIFLEQAPAATGTGTPDAPTLEALVGKTAVAETQLRPAGAVRVEGRRVPARAESGLIEKDSTVKIIASSGTEVIVRKVE